MTDFDYQYFSPVFPAKKMLVFLHGYNNTRAEMLPSYEYLQKKIPDLAIAAPEGKNSSQKEPERKSWYKVSDFDSENKRRLTETPVEEIARIYNQAAPALAETAKAVNAFITQMQQQHGFADDNTYIAGFSQGAMLAIWTALIRQRPLAGCFSFSGLAAANEHLDDCIVSRPKVYLLHGKQDKMVLFKCMEYTASWLRQEKVPVSTKAFNALDHHISAEELDFVVSTLGGK